MWKTAWLVVLVLSLTSSGAKRLAAQAPKSEPSVSSPDVIPIRRIRPTNVRVAALVARAAEQSATFRGLLDEINASDGIVYLEAGRCGAVRACLALKVTIAGPNRLLWIFVDPERGACELMASIGHELWHTVEVLREPSITSDGLMYSFFTKARGKEAPRWVETEAAVKIEMDVRAELRAHAGNARKECGES